MSPSRGAARRSGDPRKRAGATTRATPSPPSPAVRGGSHRRWAVLAALAVGGVLVVLALLAVRPDEPPPGPPAGEGQAVDQQAADPQAVDHAEAACDLTTKAGEAADAVEVDKRSRYAAAVLLLDRAIIESGRAVQLDGRLTELDSALQAVHVAGHEGDPDGWQAALDSALSECRSALG